jgi:GAF domain-containing protein
MTANLHTAIVLQVAELTRDLREQRFTDSLEKPLADLVATAAESVPGADHAAITLVGPDGVRAVAATARYPGVVGKFRQRRSAGLCAPATWDQEVIRIDDVTTERQTTASLARAGPRSGLNPLCLQRAVAPRASSG